jgi:hypothetical protein
MLSSDREAFGDCERGQRPVSLQPCVRTQTDAVHETDHLQQDVLYPLVLISVLYAKS